MSDDGLKVIRSFPGLEILDVLRSPDISDDGLANLAGLTAMRQLSLRGTPINGSGLAHLKRCASCNTSISTKPRSTTGTGKPQSSDRRFKTGPLAHPADRRRPGEPGRPGQP